MDFESVHAKANGATRFPGIPHEALAALLTRFSDSELGRTPEGGGHGTIGDVASPPRFAMGSRQSSSRYSG